MTGPAERETRSLVDPFTGKPVEIGNRLTDRLRGKYACGPMLPNGEPEFGWRQHPQVPIQAEAAARIEALEAETERFRSALDAIRSMAVYERGERTFLLSDIIDGCQATAAGALEDALSPLPARSPS